MTNSQTTMRFFLLIFVLVQFNPINVLANPKLDSLMQELANSTPDSNKVNVYLSIGNYYLAQQNDSCLIFSQKSLELARELDFLSGIVHSLNLNGNYYERSTQYDKALEYYEEALSISKENNYTKGLAIVLNNIAIVHTRKADYKKALGLYFQALEAEEIIKNKQGIAQAYNNIGIIYYYQSNLDKALEYFEKSIAIEEEIGDVEVLKKNYSNMGVLYNHQKNYQKALHYYQKSYALNQQLGDQMDMSINLNNIATIYQTIEQIDSAIWYHNQSLQLKEQLGDYRGIAFSYHNFAALYKNQNDFKKAEDFYNKSLAITKEKRLKEIESQNYKALSELFLEQEKHQQAHHYLQQHLQLQDSLLNEASTKAIAEIEAKYETAKQEKALLEQEAQINKQNLAIQQKDLQLIWMGGIGIILFLIGILFFYHQYQRTKRLQQEHQLNQALAKIETQEQLQQQRLQISRDLHDNIGAQLTFIISSIGNLKYAFKLEHPPLLQKLETIGQFTKDTIWELRDTIWAMNQQNIRAEDLKNRVQSFLAKAQSSTNNINFDFKIAPDAMQHVLTSVEGMNIYRIIQEALNNSLKYAHASNIKVAIRNTTTNFQCVVEDNGIGFKNATIVRGNGLNNMKKRAQDIQAQLDIKTTPNQGTSVQINLPKTKLSQA